MNENRVLCDRCKTAGAEHFALFKERKTGAAGSGEDWYYIFDLCFSCTAIFLGSILKNRALLYKGLLSADIIKIIENLQIKYRIG
jgi:hypothetical protein